MAALRQMLVGSQCSRLLLVSTCLLAAVFNRDVLSWSSCGCRDQCSRLDGGWRANYRCSRDHDGGQILSAQCTGCDRDAVAVGCRRSVCSNLGAIQLCRHRRLARRCITNHPPILPPRPPPRPPPPPPPPSAPPLQLLKRAGALPTGSLRKGTLNSGKGCACGRVKRACYGFRGDAKPTSCAKCKSEGMVDLVNKKCKCGLARPNFGFPTDARPTCCAKCKSEEMVDIIHRKCKCGFAQPHFGFPDDARPTCCVKCKSEDMVHLQKRMCVCEAYLLCQVQIRGDGGHKKSKMQVRLRSTTLWLP
eukprot:TRINITY_DN11337_c0_g1_i2.p1 TRINITY_DN11337_c0_g1~~TRINITY_DN11337_c0_g1_i2.p1  ORF type:complete len:304 (+),score=29.68 TRINITY_DN11337_c0_g1_i2:66-977(+)